MFGYPNFITPLFLKDTRKPSRPLLTLTKPCNTATLKDNNGPFKSRYIFHDLGDGKYDLFERGTFPASFTRRTLQENLEKLNRGNGWIGYFTSS